MSTDEPMLVARLEPPFRNRKTQPTGERHLAQQIANKVILHTGGSSTADALVERPRTHQHRANVPVDDAGRAPCRRLP